MWRWLSSKTQFDTGEKWDSVDDGVLVTDRGFVCDIARLIAPLCGRGDAIEMGHPLMKKCIADLFEWVDDYVSRLPDASTMRPEVYDRTHNTMQERVDNFYASILCRVHELSPVLISMLETDRVPICDSVTIINAEIRRRAHTRFGATH